MNRRAEIGHLANENLNRDDPCVLGRRNSEELSLVRQDLSSVIVFLMKLDARVDELLIYFDIDDGEEEEETED